MAYFSPASLAEALAVKAELKAQVKPIAGGTDVLVQIDKKRLPMPANLMDLSSLAELDYIRADNGRVHIGATASQTAVAQHPLIQEFAPALAEAILTIGGRQIRNRATLAGNIVNASPAADTVPVLIALDAQLVLKSAKETRTVPLASFIIGPGKTLLGADELLTEVFFPQPGSDSKTVFMKLGKRVAMNIAAINSVVRLDFNPDDTVRDARIVLGSVFPGPLIPDEAQATLAGEPLSQALIDTAASQCAAAARPIDDVRASAQYRKAMVEVFVRRSLNEIWEWRQNGRTSA